MSDWYKAFIRAGVTEEEANKASQELADIKTDVIKLAGEVNMLKWMAGTNVAISVAILLRILFT